MKLVNMWLQYEKRLYIDKLDDIVNKYNNKNHKAIKMKLFDVIPGLQIEFDKENNNEGPEFKVGDNVLEYQNIQIFFKKVIFRVGLRTVLWLKMLKTMCCGHLLLVILIVRKLLESLTKNNCKKQIKRV